MYPAGHPQKREPQNLGFVLPCLLQIQPELDFPSDGVYVVRKGPDSTTFTPVGSEPQQDPVTLRIDLNETMTIYPS